MMNCDGCYHYREDLACEFGHQQNWVHGACHPVEDPCFDHAPVEFRHMVCDIINIATGSSLRDIIARLQELVDCQQNMEGWERTYDKLKS